MTRVLDYQSLKETNPADGSQKDILQPASNVLQFYTEDGTKISARPSGTEPKIKFYVSVHTSLASASDYDATEAYA